MSSPLPSPPDPMPLREALRGLRHLLRRGGDSLRETMQPDLLPPPASQMAGLVLREAKQLAHGMNRAASGLARRVLEAPAPVPRHLDDLSDEAAFGRQCYAALGSVLGQLKAGRSYLSEAAARAAYRQAVTGGRDASFASRLALAMVDQRVIRDMQVATETRFAPGVLEPVACFAVLLWLKSNRPEDEDAEALASAVDLSATLSKEISAAFAARNSDRLGELFREWTDHV